MMCVSLDCPFLIAPSVFFNVYIEKYTNNTKCIHCTLLMIQRLNSGSYQHLNKEGLCFFVNVNSFKFVDSNFHSWRKNSIFVDT